MSNTYHLILSDYIIAGWARSERAFTSIFMIVKRNHINLSTVKFEIFDIHANMRLSLLSFRETKNIHNAILYFLSTFAKYIYISADNICIELLINQRINVYIFLLRSNKIKDQPIRIDLDIYIYIYTLITIRWKLKKRICRYDPPLWRARMKINVTRRNSTRKDDPRASLCQLARRRKREKNARAWKRKGWWRGCV